MNSVSLSLVQSNQNSLLRLMIILCAGYHKYWDTVVNFLQFGILGMRSNIHDTTTLTRADQNR